MAALFILTNYYFYSISQAINQPDADSEYLYKTVPKYLVHTDTAIEKSGIGYYDVKPMYYRILYIDMTILISGLLLFWASKTNKKYHSLEK